MSIIRTRNAVPQVYTAESRDFQLFTRVLDFVENSIKYDVDSMLNVLSTEDISEEYLDLLRDKVGFFSDSFYDEETLRKTLSAMPYILRNKGSELGIEMCINTFLNIVGFRRGYTVSIYNNDSLYQYTIRIGIEGSEINTGILKDMLSYVIPAGYFIEFYFYTYVESPNTGTKYHAKPYILQDKDYTLISSIRDKTIVSDLYESTYNTVQLTTIYNPKENTNQGEITSNE